MEYEWCLVWMLQDTNGFRTSGNCLEGIGAAQGILDHFVLVGLILSTAAFIPKLVGGEFQLGRARVPLVPVVDILNLGFSR